MLFNERLSTMSTYNKIFNRKSEKFMSKKILGLVIDHYNNIADIHCNETVVIGSKFLL